MVSLQMAGRYLRVNSLCNKHRVVHFHLSAYGRLHLHEEVSRVHSLILLGSHSQESAMSSDLTVNVKDKKSGCRRCWGADRSSTWTPQCFCLFVSYFCLLLIIHKWDHPLFWTLAAIFAGSERVASCSLWRRFLRCGQSCLETTSSPFTCPWNNSGPEEDLSCVGQESTVSKS